jgi:hypothetical protein
MKVKVKRSEHVLFWALLIMGVGLFVFSIYAGQPENTVIGAGCIGVAFFVRSKAIAASYKCTFCHSILETKFAEACSKCGRTQPKPMEVA